MPRHRRPSVTDLQTFLEGMEWENDTHMCEEADNGLRTIARMPKVFAVRYRLVGSPPRGHRVAYVLAQTEADARDAARDLIGDAVLLPITADIVSDYDPTEWGPVLLE